MESEVQQQVQGQLRARVGADDDDAEQGLEGGGVHEREAHHCGADGRAAGRPQ